MIPQRYITEWKSVAPWPTDAQVEQDLLISRVLYEIFSDDLLKKSLAFRGGTALHKLYLQPQIRYSEDIDLVQVDSEPIHPVLKRIREKLAPILGTKRKVEQHIHNNTVIYRFETSTQPVINMRLKIEINTREHFNVLGIKEFPFKVESSWFFGECLISTYEIEELLGTKLRALYQRRKGRDLFDLFWALSHHDLDIEKVLQCYKVYIDFSVENPPTKKQFLANMEEKMSDEEFLQDIYSILKPELEYDNMSSFNLVKGRLIDLL